MTDYELYVMWKNKAEQFYKEAKGWHVLCRNSLVYSVLATIYILVLTFVK